MIDDKYQSAFILYESSSNQRKCIACQSNWFRFYADKSDIVWDFQITKRRRAREKWWKYSSE